MGNIRKILVLGKRTDRAIKFSFISLLNPKYISDDINFIKRRMS